MTQNAGNWFIKMDNRVTGPFSTAVICNHLTVGRLQDEDLISTDGETWQPIVDIEALKPNIGKEELDKAKRHLDERTGRDRREQQSPFAEHLVQRKGERRDKEPQELIVRRQLRQMLMDKYLAKNKTFIWPLFIAFLFLIGLWVFAVKYPTLLPMPEADCSSSAAPNINWSNCVKPRSDLNNLDMQQAKLRSAILAESQLMNTQLQQSDLAYTNLFASNLAYSNLEAADLTGANLNAADLSYSHLKNANLSYANLTNANLSNADLTGAKLDNAIWTDGTICLPNSIGQCKTR